MSTLLVDIGNTRVKWARLTGTRLARQRAAAHAHWGAKEFATQVIGRQGNLQRVVVVSVASARINDRFVAAARRAGLEPLFVRSKRRTAGVTTAYVEPWRLGTDRLVAVIGAHQLAPRRAVCVIDLGTAITIDLLDHKGRHRGGAIVPSPQLMVDSLKRDTSGILRRARGGGGGKGLFARSTSAALAQGARYAAAAVIDRAVSEARRELGAAPLVFVTGGGAPTVRPLLRSRHRHIPDLVLRGLAVL